MQSNIYKKVLTEADFILKTLNSSRAVSTLPNFHDEIVSYIRENYWNFDGSYKQLKKITKHDGLIRSLWYITRNANNGRLKKDDTKMLELFSVYRGTAPLLMGLFKEATDLEYEDWYFIKDPDACEESLNAVITGAVKRRAPAYSTLARYLLLKLLAYKAYSNMEEKELISHLVSVRAKIDEYINSTEDSIHYLECPKHEPSEKNTIGPKEILGSEAYDYIKHISESLNEELIMNAHTSKMFSANIPYRPVCQIMLQYCSTTYDSKYYELTINNPLDFDKQLPDLRKY